jgi:ankyrin repeat protein
MAHRLVCPFLLILLGCLGGCQWFQAPPDPDERPEVEEANRRMLTAIRQGDAEEVRRQIIAGAEVNLEGPVQTRPIPIMVAARRGDPAVMRVLMEAGADVNVRDAMGATPLMHAAWEGHAEAVRMLVGAGAEVNAQNVEGVTALEAAKERNQTEVVQILLQAGAESPDPPEALADPAIEPF